MSELKLNQLLDEIHEMTSNYRTMPQIMARLLNDIYIKIDDCFKEIANSAIKGEERENNE